MYEVEGVQGQLCATLSTVPHCLSFYPMVTWDKLCGVITGRFVELIRA